MQPSGFQKNINPCKSKTKPPIETCKYSSPFIGKSAIMEKFSTAKELTFLAESHIQ